MSGPAPGDADEAGHRPASGLEAATLAEHPATVSEHPATLAERTVTVPEHTATVAASFAGAGDARLGAVVAAAVRHLHAFSEEVGLTRDEWLAGLRYLTEVGHTCDDVRQEFVLLSDVLGLSTLVELLDGSPASTATESTILGPFYVPGSPVRAFGDSIVDDPATGGEPLVLGGQISDVNGSPVAGARIDVWQVQPNGRYDIEDDPAKRNLRGVFTSRDDGAYEIRTVRPVDYTIADDGPVGALLRAAGRHPWRPTHVHLIVEAPGFRRVVTHVFDEESPWIGSDAVFGVRPSLCRPMAGGSCRFDVVLERA